MSENIKQLSEKEKVRKKISVWLGASNHIAVIHTVKELVGNSTDEINKGNGSRVDIILHENNKQITVLDNCQGLPIEGKNDNGVENYKLLFETLFAGTKYDNGIDNNDYTVGVNGVFNTVLAFSALDVTFEVGRPDGNIYSISYHKGDLSEPLHIIGSSTESGTYTKITYTLDDDIFEENHFNIEELKEIASEQASLINGTISVTQGTEEYFYKYENGILGLLEERNEGKNSIHEPIQISKTIGYGLDKVDDNGNKVVDTIKINMVMQYTHEDENDVHIEFLNGSHLIHHGTIYDGIVNGMKSVLHKFAKDNNLYDKKEKQISKDDVLIGMNYIVDFKSFFPVYANQTKFASYVKYYEPTMKDVIENFFESFAIENKKEMEIITKKVLVNKRSREKAEKTRTDIKKKLSGTVNNITNRIDGFVPCKSRNAKKCEYYIVEGKSALGSTVQGRDKDTQAIQAIRGKILNCLKAKNSEILNNEVIQSFIKALGCGCNLKNKKGQYYLEFNIDKLNYDKIIICTDGDVDGFHIRTLLITCFKVVFPELIKQGKLYIVESPLFEIVDKQDKSYFAYNEKEKQDIVNKLGNNVMAIQRSKGLGENTSDMMWETTMNPETRRLIRVTIDDGKYTEKETEDTFNMLLGNDAQERAKYITENMKYYIDEI